jgi:hypothetical protein
MQGHIFAELAPVRRRQQRLFALQSAVLGVIVSAVAGIVLGITRWFAGSPESPLAAVGVLAAGPVIGLLVGLLWRRSWHAAAVAVDEHYGLKDRATSALAFLAKPETTTLQELEIHDAEEHLTKIHARDVVPFRVPRPLPYAAGLLVAALALFVLPLTPRTVQAEPSDPLAEVLAEAEKISEDLEQLNELAKEERDPELEELVHELQEMLEEMVQPGVDVKEALAKLSEMQAAISAQQAQYNVGLVDGQLQSLGQAMMTAQPLEGAGKALQEAKFDRAAKELEELEDVDFDKKEAKTTAEKMKQVADAMGEVGLGELSDDVSEMCEGMSSGQKGKFMKASKSLAAGIKKQGSRKRVYDILENELARLNECKGECKNPKNSLAKGKKPEKSLSPTLSFGMSTSGNVIGDKTNLLAKRNVEEITGNPGEGPAEMETMHSPEGREQAGRSYRDVYNKYKKESEAVLDSEPIPLGHRETIRRYFELIRPQNAETEKSSAESSDSSK